MNEQPIRQEVGYVLLEECEVLIPASSCIDHQNEKVGSGASVVSSDWHNIDLRAHSINNAIEVGINNPDKGRELILQPLSSSENDDNYSWTHVTDIVPLNMTL